MIPHLKKHPLYWSVPSCFLQIPSWSQAQNCLPLAAHSCGCGLGIGVSSGYQVSGGKELYNSRPTPVFVFFSFFSGIKTAKRPCFLWVFSYHRSFFVIPHTAEPHQFCDDSVVLFGRGLELHRQLQVPQCSWPRSPAPAGQPGVCMSLLHQILLWKK